jgi:hypothetical protein
MIERRAPYATVEEKEATNAAFEKRQYQILLAQYAELIFFEDRNVFNDSFLAMIMN